MNFKMIKSSLGYLLLFEAGFFLIPIITALCYQEISGLAFLWSALICIAIGLLCILTLKPKNKSLYAKDGFVVVALSWIVLSIFGALPFVISGVTNSYLDAFFETVSGFTTTGSTIFAQVENLPKCILIWRSFTHWVGGMGVLVFIMAFLPLAGGHNLHIMRAESPGPVVSKLVPKIKTTATILYAIYFALTVLMVILLSFDMSLFEAINTAFATAGTGGFGVKNDSIASFSSYVQIVTTVFMLIFSINFNSYYLVLKARPKEALNTEVKVFVGIVAVAITIITVDLSVSMMTEYGSAGEALKHAAFNVASVISTTGFSSADFNLWPELSQTVLVLIMFVGACAGSTGGGIKVSRIIIMFKQFLREIGMLAHPKQIKNITIDKKPVGSNVIRSVNAYLVCYITIFVISCIVISFDAGVTDLVTSFTATLATIANVGPGLAAVGPMYNFAFFSPLSKLMLCFNMLAGRLELFPMLILIAPSTWRK